MSEARARFDRNGRISEPELQRLMDEQKKRLEAAQEIADELTRSLKATAQELARISEPPS